MFAELFRARSGIDERNCTREVCAQFGIVLDIKTEALGTLFYCCITFGFRYPFVPL